uniref:Cupin 2 conserved barrel domain protein n=1 Tax=Cyanothece sp. (strain PCC 7425 / ATCC 29141) TaxID=395961 RepID=B8HQH3_CYAP4
MAAQDIIVHNSLAAPAQASPDFRGFSLAKLENLGSLGVISEKIPAGRQGIPHYHREGIDIFCILQGNGELLLADLSADSQSMLNERRIPVSAGSLYVVPAGIIHSLSASSDSELVFINVAPPEHLTTDRLFLSQYLQS